RSDFAELIELYLDPIAEQQTFHSPLLNVLERIAAEGPAGFYEGEVGSAIVAAVRNRGGILTTADLRDVRPALRSPVSGEFRGYQVISMPPPSSGGIALLQTLGILNAYESAH